MCEWHLGEFDVALRIWCSIEQRIPGYCPVDCDFRAFPIEIRHQYGGFKRRQSGHQFANFTASRIGLAAVSIAIDAEQESRLQLRKAIENTGYSEIR